MIKIYGFLTTFRITSQHLNVYFEEEHNAKGRGIKRPEIFMLVYYQPLPTSYDLSRPRRAGLLALLTEQVTNSQPWFPSLLTLPL